MNKELFLNRYKEAMINYLVEEIDKKKSNKSKYLDNNGRFKVMTCPDDQKKKSRFCGCVRYMMSQGKSLESAKKLCGYLKTYVKKNEYNVLKLKLENEILKSDKIDKKFIKSLFDEVLISVSKDGELDDVDKMLVSGWIVLRRF